MDFILNARLWITVAEMFFSAGNEAPGKEKWISSDSLKIAEIPSRIWNFNHYFELPVDRSRITVNEYLRQRNIEWRFGDDPSADFRVYKEENLRNGLLSFRRLKNESQKRIEKKPYINLNGEAQENSKISYLLADPDKTFSVAPGNKFITALFSEPVVRPTH